MTRARNPVALAVVLTGILAATSSRAAESDVQVLPCRPTIACTADIVPAGVFEVETGTLSRFAHGSAMAVPILGKLSLTSWFQAQVGTSGLSSSSTGTFVDLVTGLGKFRVLEQGEWSPSVAFTVGGSVAVTPESTTYAPAQGFQAAGLASRDFGRFHVDVNGGYSADVGDKTVTHAGWGALSTSFTWTSRIGTFHEVYYLGSPRPRVPKDGGVLFGLAYSPRPDFMVDVGADVGFFPDDRAVSAFFGITAVLGRIYGSPPPATAQNHAAYRRVHPL
jgi:hypothetical protein